MIRSSFPDAGDKYIYFNVDVDKLDDLSRKVLMFQRVTGSTGVPFTVLLDNGRPTGRIVRGYDPRSLKALMEEVMSEEEPKGGEQLEIPFKDD